MILKDYQAAAIENLSDFLRRLNEVKSLKRAFAEFWAARDVTANPPYQSTLPRVPQVCFKVPTGGGKTFMAAASLKVIFDALPATQEKVVVWLVPSETILTQTYKNLSDAAHPYRHRLNADFNGQVAVYGKAQLLAGENFSPAEVAEQLSILVLSYDSFRTSNKDGRKAYQQNGQLNQFVEQFTADEEILDGADESSLINVIRHYQPIVIVDESHHATTDLSVEMLSNFNPSFVLELTATPKPQSNVIAYVPAAKLKAAGMVKLPVIVYNRHDRDEVISDAITFRNSLERVGSVEGIRPIVLFQAESQGKGDRATFDKIKADLIQNHGIPAAQIAVKTAEINDLKNIDLLAADCPIRYIITINALKEGWDCPFAYILASLANRTSAIDVEQILGRILRRPFTKNFSDALLNQSYVLTSSADFRATLDKIVAGLNASGFSRHEYRAVDVLPQVELDGCTITLPPQSEPVAAREQNIFDTPSTELNIAAANSLDEMIERARQADTDYPTAGDVEIRSEEELAKMNVFKIRDRYRDALDLRLPQFFCRQDSLTLFGETVDLPLDNSLLLDNFTLADKDTAINFDGLNYEVASLDIYDEEDSPRYRGLSEIQLKGFLEHFDRLPTDGQIHQCAELIAGKIDKHKNAPSRNELASYVTRIVRNFDREQIRDAAIHANAYANKIWDKIDALQTVHKKKYFDAQIAARKIFVKPSYKLPAEIPLINHEHELDNSLYDAEDSVNNLEWRIAYDLTSLENILWWHRNLERKGFCLNGFINHYPDFIVRTKSGVTLLVEAKGDDRDNSDSRLKLELGKIWESKAGTDNFGYFMVFDNKPIDGALRLDDFVSALKGL